MKLKRSLLFNIALAFLAASSVFFLSHIGILNRAELSSLDFSFRLRGALPSNPNIVVIEITDSDIAKIGRWPWKRSWHAAMAKALTGMGARSIYFDIIFSEPSSSEDDGLFEEAIRLGKNVYLPFVLQDSTFDEKNALLPLNRFSSHIKGTGALNVYPDIDGTIRTIPLLFPDGKGLYPHAVFKIALDYAGLKIEDIRPEYITLSDAKGKFRMPLVKKNTLLINWLGKWQNTFKHYSFLEVLSGSVNPDDFKDRICLVGVTAIGLYDIKPIPLQGEYPGIGVVATTIDNILDRNFIFSPPGWVNILILFFLALIPAFLIRGEKPLKETAFVFLISAIYFLADFFLFKKGIRLGFSTPLIGLFASYLSVGTYNFVRVSVERQSFFNMAVTDGLTCLFNIRYFKMLVETELMLAKSDPTKRFVIIMTDVDHFRGFNDTYGHQVGDLVLKEVAHILRSSVRTSDVVARYGGEEMIVILRGASLDDGLKIAEKIRKGVEDHVAKDEKNTYRVTISLGVAAFKIDDDVDSIIKRADDGLYRAKQAGRNRIFSIERPQPS